MSIGKGSGGRGWGKSTPGGCLIPIIIVVGIIGLAGKAIGGGGFDPVQQQQMVVQTVKESPVYVRILLVAIPSILTLVGTYFLRKRRKK